jgi:hypothetical protein
LRAASKFFDDIFYSNTHFAIAGGIPLQEMNVIEIEFLYAIEFDLTISDMTIDAYQRALLQQKNPFE